MSFFSVRAAVNRAAQDGEISDKEAQEILDAAGDEIYVEEHAVVDRLLKDHAAGKVSMTPAVKRKLQDGFQLRESILVHPKGAWATFADHVTAPLTVGLLTSLVSRVDSPAGKAATIFLGLLASAVALPITVVTGTIFGLKRLFED